MKKISFLLFAFCISVLPMKLKSQNTTLTLEDLTPGGKTYNKYRISFPRQLSWLGDKLAYTKGDSILLAPLNDKQKDGELYLNLAQLNSALSKSGYDEIKTMTRVAPVPNNNQLFVYSDKICVYDIEKKAIVGAYNYSKELANPDFADNTLSVAYTIDNNLYLQSADGIETQITTDTDKGIVNGQSVHRNEFGIKKGTYWSPKGNLLAFYRMDETMVDDYPLVDISTRIATEKPTKYPMAGMKSHQVTLGVFDPATKKTVYMKTSTPKEKYLTNIAWGPDEKSIYIAELNRRQDTCVVKQYNAQTGKLEATLFTETSSKYVEPEHPVLFLKNDPKRFIWQSKRDGYNHLYIYNTNGTLDKQLTSGSWDVTDVIGFDEKGENILITSTEQSVIENHIYLVNLKTGNRFRISEEEGIHSPVLSGSGKYIYDRYESQFNPGKIAVADLKTKKNHTFYEAKNPYRNVNMPEITIGTVKADDGKTDLYYRIIKPADFDPNKKYPVVVYVYGGPHLQMVNNGWMAQTRGWDIYMAQQGYIVFSLDNRGTPNRGIEFENITHGRLGEIETQDQMSGVNYLKALPYVDTERIGVFGWSFGGFMTMNLMLRHPETFKVGVAGGPVTDWKYYEIMYGERYMGSPKDNPEGYENSSMVNRAGDLKGRLLIIHGDEDPTVVMQNSLQFLKAAVASGTHPDFFIYPGHEHNVLGPDRVHLHEHVTRYFEDFLK